MLPSCGFRVFVVYVTGLGSLDIYHLLLVQSAFYGSLLLKLHHTTGGCDSVLFFCDLVLPPLP